MSSQALDEIPILCLFQTDMSNFMALKYYAYVLVLNPYLYFDIEYFFLIYCIKLLVSIDIYIQNHDTSFQDLELVWWKVTSYVKMQHCVT